MQRINAVEDDAGGAGAGEGGGDFATDVPALADAGDDELAATLQRVHHQRNGPLEGVVELRAHCTERSQFDVEHFASASQVTHGDRACQRGKEKGKLRIAVRSAGTTHAGTPGRRSRKRYRRLLD